MKIFVTGATGHVGICLMNELQKIKNAQITALILNNDQDVKYLNQDKINFVYGDVRAYDLLNENILENSIVIHLASFVSITNKDRKKVVDINVGGTKNIVDICKKKNAYMIYVSSVHALKATNSNLIDENSELNVDSKDSCYEESKSKATKLVREALNDGLKGSIIYPSGILGPFDYKNSELTCLLEMIDKDQLIAYIKGGYAFVDVRDVCSIILKLASSQIIDEFIVSGEYLSIEDIIKIVQEFKKKKIKIPCISKTLAILAIPFLSLKAKILKKKPLFSLYSLKTLNAPCNFKNDKVEMVFDFSYTPIKKTILDSLKRLKLIADKN